MGIRAHPRLTSGKTSKAKLAPSLLVAPGRPFVHLFIPSRRLRQEGCSTDLFVSDATPLGAGASADIRDHGKHRPRDTSEFVGERYCQHVTVEPLRCLFDPRP